MTMTGHFLICSLVSALFLFSCVTSNNASDDGSFYKESAGLVELENELENITKEVSSLIIPDDSGAVSTSTTSWRRIQDKTPRSRVTRQAIVNSPVFDFSQFARGLQPGGPSSSSTAQDVSRRGNGCQVDRCLPVRDCTGAVSLTSRTCTLSNGAVGVCCPLPGVRLTAPPLQGPGVPMTPVPDSLKEAAIMEGLAFIKHLDSQEGRLVRDKIILRPFTPERAHQRFFRVTPSARAINEAALMVTQASSALVQRMDLSKEESIHGLRQVEVSRSLLGNICPVPPICKPQAKYRSVDGSCNNEKRSLLGKSETPFARLVAPAYDDGVSTPRYKSVSGFILPNVRVISHHLMIDIDSPDPDFTLSVMQWGQFMDHDLTHAPFQSLKANGEGIECCRDGLEITGPERHPKCWPIILPANDAYYGPKGITCLNFIRSMQAVNDDCTFGPAEQMNQITHWLDGSNIYGSSAEEASRLRLGSRGLLKTSVGSLLPIDDTLTDHDCKALKKGGHCFFSGDSRVNEQPGLTAIHTLFHREHNRVAEALGHAHRDWSDEALFQEARRIVIAEIQHITYNEWLPIIVGDEFMDSYDLKPQFGKFRYDYNSNINPNIMNEFATAAFRFGHSLVQGNVRLHDKNGDFIMRLKEHFGSPHIFSQYTDALDMISRSLTREHAQKFDSFISKELSNHLFETSEKGYGMDLMSLNIHRGRDHGITSYNDMREVCGLPRAENFADFADHIPPQLYRTMGLLYTHVDDVDFFVGGMSERPVSGGLLGWTFLCIVGEQFQKLKMGDKYFYDVGGEPSSFTQAQLVEIQKASWARILCDNTDTIAAVQALAFRLVDRLNPLIDCRGDGIAHVDLRPWAREQPQA